MVNVVHNISSFDIITCIAKFHFLNLRYKNDFLPVAESHVLSW